MKTSIKDIIIGIFAIIGFYAVVTGFNSPQETQTEQTIITGTPESHQWDMVLKETNNTYFLFNRVTGEVRHYEIVNSPGERKAIREGEGNEIIYRTATKVSQNINY